MSEVTDTCDVANLSDFSGMAQPLPTQPQSEAGDSDECLVVQDGYEVKVDVRTGLEPEQKRRRTR